MTAITGCSVRDFPILDTTSSDNFYFEEESINHLVDYLFALRVDGIVVIGPAIAPCNIADDVEGKSHEICKFVQLG